MVVVVVMVKVEQGPDFQSVATLLFWFIPQSPKASVTAEAVC